MASQGKSRVIGGRFIIRGFRYTGWSQLAVSGPKKLIFMLFFLPDLHELVRKSRKKFCLLPSDVSEEPSRKCSEQKLVQMILFYFDGASFTISKSPATSHKRKQKLHCTFGKLQYRSCTATFTFLQRLTSFYTKAELQQTKTALQLAKVALRV